MRISINLGLYKTSNELQWTVRCQGSKVLYSKSVCKPRNFGETAKNFYKSIEIDTKVINIQSQ